jgi:HK97 family phage portal protein
MCPGDHWRLNSKGGRDRVKNSALSRILRHPNAYQSISDFLLNATRSLFLDGNAYALALRNDRYEIAELHLMDARMSAPQVATTGDVFYWLAGNDVIDRQTDGQIVVPQRDVLHIRLHSDRRFPRPLVGETPLTAALSDIGVNDAIAQQQMQFYANQARPSAVLSTDLVLDKDQVQFLRDRWDEQSRGLNQGKTPILTAGLKVQPWSVGGKDAQIAEVMKMSQERIALVFRVPLQLLGLSSAGFGSTEAMMQFGRHRPRFCAQPHRRKFRACSLKGQPDEYAESDTSALLHRPEGSHRGARARCGRHLRRNEARNSEGYPDVEYGDEPRAAASRAALRRRQYRGRAISTGSATTTTAAHAAEGLP